MTKPKIKTKKYVDWQDLKRFLSESVKYKDDFIKYKDEIWTWFCSTSDFGNGHYVSMERQYETEYPGGVAWLTKILYAEFPDAAESYFGIPLWVRW